MNGPRTTAATDGSALGNPGPGGWAWYVDGDTHASGSEAHTTNNRMELVALRELLVATAATVRLDVLCDSEYVVKAFTAWVHGWRRRGWRTAGGDPVKNRDLIEEICVLLEGRDVTLTWVRGHAGHPLNEAADTLARAAAELVRAGRRT